MIQTWQVTQRVSFPKKLFSGCAPKFSDVIVELRDDLDATASTNSIRAAHPSPVFACPRCGHVGESAGPHVRVRAMILSLIRFGIAVLL
jgi:hypothetical protein